MFELIGLGIKGASTWLQGRQDIKKAKQQGALKIVETELKLKAAVNEARIKMAENGQAQDYNLDEIAMQEMKNSYLDEILLIVFLYPVFDAYIAGGFKALELVPNWYMALVVGMVVVKYGMRGMLKDFMSGKYKGIFSKKETH
jgi:hypothetical protein